MKKTRIISLILVVLTVAAVLASCGDKEKSAEHSFIGSWTMERDDEAIITFVFQENGQGVIYVEETTSAMTYTTAGENEITIVSDAFGSKMVGTYEFSDEGGNEYLSLTFNGGTERLKRDK